MTINAAIAIANFAYFATLHKLIQALKITLVISLTNS